MSASVLFVDDEEKARKYFALAMSSDFDVKTAGSAAEALAILAEHPQQVAVIISDQRMPEKSGVELLKTVREYYPDIVRLLTTAYTDLEDAIEAINRGEILRYIQKPWDITTLKSELKHALNYFQLRSERDALLREKLSVRQGMVQIERISQLLLLAEALPGLRFTGQAMCRYVDQLVAIKSSTATKAEPNSAPLLDLWTQTLGETARMKRFIRLVADELRGHLTPGGQKAFDTQLDLPALRRLVEESAHAVNSTLQVKIVEDPATPANVINVDATLFRLMLVNLFSVLHKDAGSIVMRIAGTGSAPHTGLQMIVESSNADLSALPVILDGPATQEIPAACAQLLLAFLACNHHGGSLEIAADGSTVLSLPGNPDAAKLQADERDWHENVLASFEPEML